MRFVHRPEFDGVLSPPIVSSSSSSSKHKKRSFQLAAMSAFLLATKVAGEYGMTPFILSGLSRNLFTPQDIVRGEKAILEGLRWRVHPVTSSDILYQLFQLFLSFRPLNSCTVAPGKATDEMDFWNTSCPLVREITSHIVEVAATDLLFKDESPLHIALAAIFFAIEHVPLPTTPCPLLIDQFKEVVTRETGEDADGADVQSTVASFIQVFNHRHPNPVFDRDMAAAIRTQGTETPTHPYLAMCGFIPSLATGSSADAVSPKRRAASPIGVDEVEDVDLNITRKTRRINID
ncbi:hypothetical protein TrCOL_g6970 [Triparma columacea]|uniref:Cyclin N-terminal domain-containing protein n=1 Tax=Triparma columacea TaxID=722753 RepID=A0A9W7GJW5_9STRA|nr:hypothetical protein TrCOL_g6970 [Triparma columacea]